MDFDIIYIYTDGSKISTVKSVSSASYCSQLNTQILNSINTNASIYTAECLAIDNAIKIALENKNKNVTIVCDSLSALEALGNPKISVKTNPIIFEIRQKIYKFKTINNHNNDINFLWIPSHKGIINNEIVDNLAKIATESEPTV